MRHNRKEM